MEPSLAVVRKFLFLAGMALAGIGALEIVATVVNPDWWRILGAGGMGWFGGDGFLSRVQAWLNTLQQGFFSMVWGFVAMGLGHLLPKVPVVESSEAIGHPTPPNPLP